MTTSLTPDARQALRDAADAHAESAQSLRTMSMLLESAISANDAASQSLRTASLLLQSAISANDAATQTLRTAAASTAAVSMEALRSSVDAAVNLNVRASSALTRAADALEIEDVR